MVSPPPQCRAASSASFFKKFCPFLHWQRQLFARPCDRSGSICSFESTALGQTSVPGPVSDFFSPPVRALFLITVTDFVSTALSVHCLSKDYLGLYFRLLLKPSFLSQSF